MKSVMLLTFREFSFRSAGVKRSVHLRLMPFIGLVIMLSTVSCKDDDPQTGETISFEQPANFPSPVYQFNDNGVTNNRFQLGRKLFYDPVLSLDNTISCGNCHLQKAAFSHVDHDVSHGINNLLGTRNAPPIFNLAWHSNFFWDGGVNHLELQPVNPIQNPVEMGESLAHVIAKLNGSTTYKTLFNEAYGSDSITSQMMLRALAQFMAVLVSANSKYDRVMRNENGAQFTTEELNGLTLFRQKCASCHSEPLFTDLSYRNNGLDSVFSDLGRGLITLDPNDNGKFKVPSLRNISVTYPYMHDGRIKTLSKVIDHYTSGIKSSPTLDPLLANGILLSPQEKSDLLSFLQTLKDDSFLNNPSYSEIH
ncbi:MAG TPA: cytochrome c peroxidase [Bacteroidia bacterium]|nr:cytochrome c peroxidase [Bacteroidia bacterium]